MQCSAVQWRGDGLECAYCTVLSTYKYTMLTVLAVHAVHPVYSITMHSTLQFVQTKLEWLEDPHEGGTETRGLPETRTEHDG